MIDGHGHGHGDGRLKRSGTVRNGPERSGTVRNGPERSGTKWNETKKSVTVTSRDGHGHATFSVKNERFTVTADLFRKS